MKLGKEFYYLAVISIFLLIHSLYFNYIDDDAFIGLRYAKNFVEGYGLVFNIGEKVEGYSAFLFVVSEGILTKLSFSPVITSRLPGLLLGTATLYVVYLFSCMISKKNTTFNYLACVLLSVNGAFALWILGGTDIHMFTFLVLLGSYFYVRENKSHGVKFLLYSSAFFAFASLARWEGVLFFIVTLCHLVLREIYHKRGMLSKKVFVFSLGFLIIFLPYFIWRYNYYNFLFPTTFYLKVGSGVEQYKRGVRYLAEFSRDFGGIIFVFPILLFARRKIEHWMTYLTLLTVVYLVYLLRIGGNDSVMFRMVVPILPFFYILVQESFRDFYEEYIVNLKSRKASLVFLVIFALILLYTLTPSFYGKRKLDVFLDRNIQNDRHVIGMWLKDNARPQESIALNAIGEIPFLSGLYTTDMLGLTDVYIAHKRRVPSDLGIPGHEKHDSNYVLDKKPTYIILSVGYLTNISDEGDYLTDSYLFPSDRDMLNNSRLRLMYEFRSARIEDKFFNYYRRKDEFG